jgi:hypothetical protein
MSVPNSTIPKIVTTSESNRGPRRTSLAIVPGSITRSRLCQNRSATEPPCSLLNTELVITSTAVLAITTSNVSEPTASRTGQVPRSQIRFAR